MTSQVDIPSFCLNTGQLFPAVGFGCWMGAPGEGENVTRMVKDALELGYRHIDTAAVYGTEESIGKALQESHVPRHELFITTKLGWEDHGNVAAALDLSLKKLGLTYVDLYLMHWPQAMDSTGRALQPDESPTYAETWAEMEKLVLTGKTRAIGVSNFSLKTLTTLLRTANTVPSVNQIELHPALPQNDVLKFCNERGIVVTAYSPVARGALAGNAVLSELARKKGVSEVQIMLSWGVQRGTAVIPKSEKRERLKENITLVKLDSDEMREIDQIHRQPGMHRSVCGYHSLNLGGSAFGWTYKQMGWDNMVRGGIIRDD